MAKIAEENEAFGTALKEIMMTLRHSPPNAAGPKIIAGSIIPHYLNRFEENFGSHQSFAKAKVELYKKEIFTSSQLLKTLMGEIAGKLPL